LGEPLDMLIACGLGRSYGERHLVFARALPGIVECGLWSDLAARSGVPTMALITDVGNDLLYGVSVPQIAAWVEACVDRLLAAGARVVLTPLPLCSLDGLSPAKYLFWRSLLFPYCRLGLTTIRGRALDLDHRLRALAQSRKLRLAEHQAEWYGFDPIHVRRCQRATAWKQILLHWTDAITNPSESGVPWRHWLALQRLRPERRWLFGREQFQTQPALMLKDGTTLSFY
jgi:hypothetical protein